MHSLPFPSIHVNSLSLTEILNEFSFLFANSKSIHYPFHGFTTNTLFSSRIHFEFTTFFANLLLNPDLFVNSPKIHIKIHIEFKFTSNSPSILEINFDFAIIFSNSHWIHYQLSRIHIEFTIFFANTIRIHYLFHELMLNSLSYSRFHFEFTIFELLWISYLFHELTSNSLFFRKFAFNLLSISK